MTGFVRAAELYDVEAGEPLQFDWTNLQELAESHARGHRALLPSRLTRRDPNDEGRPLPRTPRRHSGL